MLRIYGGVGHSSTGGSRRAARGMGGRVGGGMEGHVDELVELMEGHVDELDELRLTWSALICDLMLRHLSHTR
jgi:hypothetical protein